MRVNVCFSALVFVVVPEITDSLYDLDIKSSADIQAVPVFTNCVGN